MATIVFFANNRDFDLEKIDESKFLSQIENLQVCLTCGDISTVRLFAATTSVVMA